MTGRPSRGRLLLWTLRWVVVVGVVVTAVIVGVEMVVGRGFSEEELRSFTAGAGWAAPLVFVGVFAVAGALVIPTTMMAVIGATLFGKWAGFAYSVGGAFIAAMAGFFVARTLGREAVSRWLNSHDGRLANLDARLESRGFSTALIMRLLYIPNGLINIACGISSIPVRDYALATLLGLTPMIFAVAFVTDGAKEAMLSGDFSSLLEVETIVAVLVFVVCVGVPIAGGFLRRRMRTRRYLSSPLTAIDEALIEETRSEPSRGEPTRSKN